MGELDSGLDRASCWDQRSAAGGPIGAASGAGLGGSHHSTEENDTDVVSQHEPCESREAGVFHGESGYL